MEGGGNRDEGREISPLGGEVRKKTCKKAIGMFLTIISLFFWEPESIKHTMIEHIVKLLGVNGCRDFRHILHKHLVWFPNPPGHGHPRSTMRQANHIPFGGVGGICREARGVFGRGVVDRRPCTSGTPPWQCFPHVVCCPMAAHPNSEEFIIGPPTTSGASQALI